MPFYNKFSFSLDTLMTTQQNLRGQTGLGGGCQIASMQFHAWNTVHELVSTDLSQPRNSFTFTGFQLEEFLIKVTNCLPCIHFLILSGTQRINALFIHLGAFSPTMLPCNFSGVLFSTSPNVLLGNGGFVVVFCC